MFILSLLSVTAAVTFLYVGISYFSMFPWTRRGSSLLLMCLALALWAFAFSFIYTAPDMEIACLWYMISGIGFIFFPAFALRHFYFRSKSIKHVPGLVSYLVYLPPAFLFAWMLGAVYKDIIFVQTPLGWHKVVVGSTAFSITFVSYYVFYLGAGLVIYLKDMTISERLRGRKTKRLMAVFVAAAVLFSTYFSQNLPSFRSTTIPNIACMVAALALFLIWHYVIRFDVSRVTYSAVAGEVLENMADGLVVVNEDGAIIFANEKACMLAGLEKDDLLGKKIDSLFADPKPDLTLKSERVDLLSGIEFRLTLINSAKKRMPVSLSYSMILDWTGNVQGGIGIMRDMRAELEFKSGQDEYQWKLAVTMSEFKDKRASMTALNDEVVDLELKMIGLKKEINALLLECGEPRRYTVKEAEG